jgi:iron complex outermembrane receptor protein
MLRRLGGLILLVLLVSCAAGAQAPSSMQGTVTDSTGAVIAGADVTATAEGTAESHRALTDAAGNYSLSGLKPGIWKLVVAKTGFQTTAVDAVQVNSAGVAHQSITLPAGSLATSVQVTAGVDGATTQPTQEEVFTSGQQLRVLDRREIEAAGPVAGAAQIIAQTPGANVTGYGNTGATKYTVGVNGVSQGWGGYGGYTGGGALAITFDGVPIADPATDLWQSPTIPEQALIQNAVVTYGPGAAATRWFNNVGGMVEFTPVQPTSDAHVDVTGTYGSFAQKALDLVLTSGVRHGFSGVFGAGAGSGNDFRNAPDGFQNPSKDLAFFGKTVKDYQSSSFELGMYYARGAGFRSQVIPVVANPLITLNGQAGSQEYSQQTSGYFSTLPYASYEKYDTNADGLIYARERVQLDPTFTLENLTWFNHIARSHYRQNDVFQTGPQQYEFNHPHTDTVGEKLLLSKRFAANTLTVGGYFLHAFYNTRNNFYNPADGGAQNVANIGGKVRSGDFTQDDFAILAQDELRLGTRFTLVPGLRYVGFSTGYGNVASQDYPTAGGGILSTRMCPTLQSATPGNIKDQGSNCGGLQNRAGLEPSASVTIRTAPWLQLYGGFAEALRAPQVGGGGGLFQSVDPSSYHLSRQEYAQGGFKIYHEGTGLLNSMLISGTFYHQHWADQEIDTTLASGDTVSANGTSRYQGFNASFDDDPVGRFHVFANINVETAVYTSYQTIVPTSSTVPAQEFNGLHVPYVPDSTVNAGLFYDCKLTQSIHLHPMASFQYVGSQYIFDNNGVDAAGNQFPQPSDGKMTSYGTLNLAVKVPYKFLELGFNALNVLNRNYLIYEYTSFGGYFGTNPNGLPGQTGNIAGYNMAYPGAPASVYGSVAAHF